MSRRRSFLWVLCALCVLAAAGCAAPMDASKAHSRSVIQNGGIVAADELRVAEYLSYYEQKFPEPVNSTLGLDLRLGNSQVPANGGEAWLQIGVQARSTRTEEIAPLNLTLVIDRSGSMDTPEKMPYVKQALRVFLQSLAPQDTVAIVAYDDRAEVILPAQKAGSRNWIDATIAGIRTDGCRQTNCTNLYAGLMLGFQEVDRNFDIRRNNRVVLLTDGMANVGVTEPERIAADAKAYNDKGIYLSTIGLGHDYNDRLLSQLASQGKGAYHFIDSAEEMDKVFRAEVSGLIQKAAADVSVLLEPGVGVRVLSLTGYDGQPPSGPVQIRLRDLGTGDNQVVLAHLDLAPGGGVQRNIVQVELRYTDLFAQRQAGVRLPVLAATTNPPSYDPLQDVEVLRNVTIQRSAEGLKEIDQLYKAERYQEAYNVALELEGSLRRASALTHEEQMTKDADLMRQYQVTLGRWVEARTGHAPLAPEATPQPRLFREANPTPASIEIQ